VDPNLHPQNLKKLQSTLEAMKEKAQSDPIYFVDTFLRTYNPEVTPSDIPFKLFPFQKRLVREILSAIKNGEDIFIDKTRKMGATYTILATFLWLWLWTPGVTLLVGSRTEEYVDNRRGGITGSKEESLFGKLDYMITRLPGFILPDAWNRDRHFNYMSLMNPDNGNSISGGSASPTFSRGARKTAIFLDEFAFWETGAQVWGATADTTYCRIVATTPGEKPSKAKRLRFGKDKEKIKVIELPYTLDPRKNAKWLETEKTRRSEDDFNREIMMNWDLSITGRIYPEIEKADYGDFPFIPNQQLFCSSDHGLDGTSFLFWQQNKENGKWRLVDSFHYEEEPIEFAFPLFKQPIDSKYTYTTAQREAFEQISKLPPSVHFGDPSISKRSGNADKESDRDKLAKIGVYVYTYTDKNSIDYRVKISKVYLQNGIEINKSERNEYSYESFKGYRWKTWDEDHETTADFRKPIHNWCSHASTAMEYLFVNLENYVLEKQVVPSWATTEKKWATNRSSIKRRY
jgi:hypothetical protein